MNIADGPVCELKKLKLAYRSDEILSDNLLNARGNSIVHSIGSITVEDCKKILETRIAPEVTEDSVLWKDFRFNQLSSEEQEFFSDKVKVTLDQAAEICCHPDKQRSEFWLQERRLRITASCAYSLVTYVDNKRPDWDSKIRNLLNNKFQGNESTAYGNHQEPFARRCYEKLKGVLVVETGLIINPLIPWLGCSPDGIVLGENTIEIKCPVEGKRKSACQMVSELPYIDKIGENLRLKKKHTYNCQVQLGMFLTNLKKCDFILYSSLDDTCIIVSVPFDEDLVLNTYIPKLQYVYFSQMLRKLCAISKEGTHEVTVQERN